MGLQIPVPENQSRDAISRAWRPLTPLASEIKEQRQVSLRRYIYTVNPGIEPLWWISWGDRPPSDG